MVRDGISLSGLEREREGVLREGASAYAELRAFAWNHKLTGIELASALSEPSSEKSVGSLRDVFSSECETPLLSLRRHSAVL